jgi:hypothetical protein
MPTCSQCGNQIVCPGHAHVVGRGISTCTLAKGALWVQVVDHAGNGVPGVEVTLQGGGKTKTTDPQGLVHYDPLDDGQQYTVEMSDTLPGTHTATHKPPQDRTGRAQVEKGKIAYVKFELVQKLPKLDVVDSYDYPDTVVVGLFAVHKLEVKNTGDAELHITKLTFPQHFPESPDNQLKDGTKLKPGDKLELETSFKPDVDGTLTGNLVIESNDLITGPKTVVLEGKAIPPWKLSVKVESNKRATVGSVPEAWVEGDVEIGISATDADHGNPVKLVTKALTQVDEGKTTADAIHTGTANATFYVWARAKTGAWFSRADVKIDLKPGETKTATVQMQALVATVSLFRGNKAIAVVPFSTTDIYGVLDAPLEDGDHGGDGDKRPGKYDAAFTFPEATVFAEVPEANADVALWRVRVKLDAAPDVAAPQDVKATLKVRASDGSLIGDARFGNEPPAAWMPTHANGYKLTLKEAKPDEWHSPYCRISTANTARDWKCASIHSIGPADKVNPVPDDPNTAPADIMNAGKQYGRKLTVEGSLYGAPFTAEVTMGGTPYARVPVKFFVATSDGAELNDHKLKRIVRQKMHQLNAWWAGQGLEFVLADPATPVEAIVAPPRRLITVGEHTGPDVVSADDFQLELKVKITVRGKNAKEETITIPIDKDQSPADVAAQIKQGIEGFTPDGQGDTAGVTLGAAVHDVGIPRAFLAQDGYPRDMTLSELGTKGPADLVLSVTNGDVVAMEISGVAVTPDDAGIDIHSPPLARPYHDAVFNPPAAATRQWIRAFGGGDKDYMVVILEGNGHGHYRGGEGYPKNLCEVGFSTLGAGAVHGVMKGALHPQLPPTTDINESKSDALTLLNFGRWN